MTRNRQPAEPTKQERTLKRRIPVIIVIVVLIMGATCTSAQTAATASLLAAVLAVAEPRTRAILG